MRALVTIVFGVALVVALFARPSDASFLGLFGRKAPSPTPAPTPTPFVVPSVVITESPYPTPTPFIPPLLTPLQWRHPLFTASPQSS